MPIHPAGLIQAHSPLGASSQPHCWLQWPRRLVGRQEGRSPRAPKPCLGRHEFPPPPAPRPWQPSAFAAACPLNEVVGTGDHPTASTFSLGLASDQPGTLAAKRNDFEVMKRAQADCLMMRTCPCASRLPRSWARRRGWSRTRRAQGLIPKTQGREAAHPI